MTCRDSISPAPPLRCALLLPLLVAAILLAGPAEAHVKWFAPYIVGAPPQPIGATLADTRLARHCAGYGVLSGDKGGGKTSAGEAIPTGMDRLSDPLWKSLDDFVRVVVGPFFVAVFDVGGVYLTPDIKTPSAMVSWAQLLIAMLIFSRRTQPLAAAGIIGLWLLALRDYDIFHLLHYLALGVGVAIYLVLEASSKPEWRKRRF